MSAAKVITLAEKRRLRAFLKRCEAAASSIRHYGLDADHRVIEIPMEEWAAMFGDHAARVVATTMVDGAMVSTVFLGLDHRFIGEGPPIVFETMVFPQGVSGLETDCWRYATWDEAVAGHDEMVAATRNKVVQFRGKK